MRNKTISKKNKDTIKYMALTLLIVAVIIVGGARERGYFWPASELMILPLAVIFIIEKRKSYTKAMKRKSTR